MKGKLSVLLLIIFLTKFSSAQNNTYLHRADSAETAWFKEAKFGIFMHWGLYSVLAGTYNGRTLPYKGADLPAGNSWYAEWIYHRLQVPDSVYRSLSKQFTLNQFNADDWIRSLRDAGAKYFVITAKHHDGFALWDSKVSTYDIAMTPVKKRDVLGELVTACKKYGLKYGFYYSHWMDWDDPYGGVPGEKPQPADEQFELYWQRKCLPQVKELIKLYNPDMLWFDTWESAGAKKLITAKRRDELIVTIRKLSKKCMINGRISFLDPGPNVDLIEMDDNQYPDKVIATPWQTSATMQRSWGYHSSDYSWKPANQMLRYLIGNISKGGNYLLNIGPKADGTIPMEARQRLQEMGAWIASNHEAVYPVKFADHLVAPKGTVIAQNLVDGKKVYYLYITDPALDGELALDIPFNTVASVTQLDSGKPYAFAAKEQKTMITLNKNVQYDCAIKILKVVLR